MPRNLGGRLLRQTWTRSSPDCDLSQTRLVGRTSRRAARLIWRALRLRCPNCGRGHLLASWFRLRERCPVCQVWLEREEGYFVGAMALNIVIGEFLPVVAAVAVIVTTWPN